MASDVLIVDDSKQLLRILELIFKCAGWHVRTAGQVSEAVELSRDQPPEIVLLDYELPDGTAVDAAEAINALTGQSIPKVLYSGHTKDILEGDSRLFVSVIMKDHLIEELPGRLQELLSEAV